jgi:hypothetical protein
MSWNRSTERGERATGKKKKERKKPKRTRTGTVLHGKIRRFCRNQNGAVGDRAPRDWASWIKILLVEI